VPKPRRMTPDLLSELIAVHSQCVLDQAGQVPADRVRPAAMLGDQPSDGIGERRGQGFQARGRDVRGEAVGRGAVREGGRVSRDDMVEPGGITSSPDGRLWRVLKVGDEKVVLSKLRGREPALSKLAALKVHLKVRAEDGSGRLFTGQKVALQRWTLTRMFRAYCEQVSTARVAKGLAPIARNAIHFHSIKHSIATILAWTIFSW
jgi:hypothetical protein